MSKLTSATHTHQREVSPSSRTTAAAITPTKLTTPNHRSRRRLDISAGPQVFAMYSTLLRRSSAYA
jgi:hypothetical protein